MKVLSDSFDKLLLDYICRAIKLGFLSNFLLDPINVFRNHKIGDFSCVKDVVDVFKECLMDDLRISHGEGYLLGIDSSVKHDLFDELMEVFVLVILLYLDLHEFNLVHEGSKFGQTLFT